MSITKATNRADQINELHQGIQKKLRTSVTDAIEIGRLLTEQQSELSHGDFLPWLKSNIACGQTTAYKYIKLHDYRFKLSSSVNLNDTHTPPASGFF